MQLISESKGILPARPLVAIKRASFRQALGGEAHIFFCAEF